MKHSNSQRLNLCVYSYSDTIASVSKRPKKRLLPKITTKVPSKNRQKSFNNYIPPEAPFVLDFVKQLINAIEKCSYLTSKWELNAVSVPIVQNTESRTKEILSVDATTRTKMIQDLLNKRNLDILLLYNQTILSHFFPKLIHFLNQDLLPVMNSPLYDSTMRPNPDFHNVVKFAVLRTSRTIIDTASFVMIHIFHTWEYSTNMIETKKLLIKTYGNLLVSFECTPRLIDRSDMSPESCLLGIILETTNVNFWNSLTSHRVFEAFDIITSTEKQLKRHIVHSNMFPDIPMIMKYDIPHLKMPIDVFFHTNSDHSNDIEDRISTISPEEDGENSTITDSMF